MSLISVAGIRSRLFRNGTTNPLGFAYQSTTGATQYAFPTGMVVTGRNNRSNGAWATIRAGGGLVLAYVDGMEIPQGTLTGDDITLYAGAAVWPTKAQGISDPTNQPNGGDRWNTQFTKFADITVGAAWVTTFVSRVATIMATNNFDGIFLDVQGARPWSSGAWGANWGDSSLSQGDWTAAEMAAWTAGSIDLVNKLNTALGSQYLIVTNNVWNSISGATSAHAYINGVCIEHHSALSGGNPSSNAIYARDATFGRSPRRVLAIATSTPDALDWLTIPNITHISDQGSYNSVSTPPVGFNDLG